VSGSDLETKLGYRFRDIGLLKLASVHKTFSYENADLEPVDNERLEFLGDAVFSLTVAHALIAHGEGLPEGIMTRIRAFLVCEAMQARLANEIDLGSSLLLGRGEDATGGREKPSNLSNALEALVGAVFLDGGWESAEAVVLHLYGDRIGRAMAGRLGFDAKSRLIEVAQSFTPQKKITYRVAAEEGPVHERTFTVEVFVDGSLCGTGNGGSKKEAEQSASASALETLGIVQ
jgi:ribonuclease-3